MNDLFGFYRGTVISRADPLKAGRCQIKIIPAFSGVSDADLPWAVPLDALMGGNPNIGSSFIPAPGAIVMCGFENGDWRYPFYMGALPSLLNNTPDIPSDSQTNYPYRKIYRSETGTEILIDDSSGNTKFMISMANGYSVTIDNSGNETENIPGTLSLTIHGNATITADANVTANISGNLQADVTGTSNLTLTGAATVNAPSTLTVVGNTIITGDLTLNGDMTTTAGAGSGTIHTVGTITSDDDVLANTISLTNHLHTGVEPGSSDTGPPTG